MDVRRVQLEKLPPVHLFRVPHVLLENLKKKVRHYFKLLFPVQWYTCISTISFVSSFSCAFPAVATSYSCNQCSKGKYATSAFVACVACPIGKYQKLDVATSYSCLECSVGQFAASAASSSCADCTAGRFQDLTVATEYQCKLCTTGRYGGEPKQTECKGCPQGTNLMDIGATSVSQWYVKSRFMFCYFFIL